MKSIRINIITFYFSQVGEDSKSNYIQFVNETGPLPDFLEVSKWHLSQYHILISLSSYLVTKSIEYQELFGIKSIQGENYPRILFSFSCISIFFCNNPPPPPLPGQTAQRLNNLFLKLQYGYLYTPFFWKGGFSLNKCTFRLYLFI